MPFISAAGMYFVLIGLTRMVGLRSFSKLSSFDFAITVAIGSILATTVVAEEPALLQGAAALVALYALQHGLSLLRRRFGRVRGAVDNQPVLLMEGERILEGAMNQVGITRADLVAKLREANVLRLEQVRAVILESTGDMSVLHAPGDDPVRLEETLLEGVRRL